MGRVGPLHRFGLGIKVSVCRRRRVRVVPIRPFLAGQAFEPEAVREMSLAFEGACEALGLRIREDPATHLVAEKVIELAQRGVRGVDELRTMTLREFARPGSPTPAG